MCATKSDINNKTQKRLLKKAEKYQIYEGDYSRNNVIDFGKLESLVEDFEVLIKKAEEEYDLDC